MSVESMPQIYNQEEMESAVNVRRFAIAPTVDNINDAAELLRNHTGSSFVKSPLSIEFPGDLDFESADMHTGTQYNPNHEDSPLIYRVLVKTDEHPRGYVIGWSTDLADKDRLEIYRNSKLPQDGKVA